MLSVAAARLGFKTCVFEPAGDCPASHVANYHLQASYEDESALKKFADSVDVITYEFENIPTSALDTLEAIRPIHPSREALRISQDRLIEKDFLTNLGLTVAPYAPVNSEADLRAAVAKVGLPAILKTCRFGYDGKGQAPTPPSIQRRICAQPSPKWASQQSSRHAASAMTARAKPALRPKPTSPLHGKRCPGLPLCWKAS